MKAIWTRSQKTSTLIRWGEWRPSKVDQEPEHRNRSEGGCGHYKNPWQGRVQDTLPQNILSWKNLRKPKMSDLLPPFSLEAACSKDAVYLLGREKHPYLKTQGHRDESEPTCLAKSTPPSLLLFNHAPFVQSYFSMTIHFSIKPNHKKYTGLPISLGHFLVKAPMTQKTYI